MGLSLMAAGPFWRYTEKSAARRKVPRMYRYNRVFFEEEIKRKGK